MPTTSSPIPFQNDLGKNVLLIFPPFLRREATSLLPLCFIGRRGGEKLATEEQSLSFKTLFTRGERGAGSGGGGGDGNGWGVAFPRGVPIHLKSISVCNCIVKYNETFTAFLKYKTFINYIINGEINQPICLTQK